MGELLFCKIAKKKMYFVFRGRAQGDIMRVYLVNIKYIKYVEKFPVYTLMFYISIAQFFNHLHLFKKKFFFFLNNYKYLKKCDNNCKRYLV